MRHLPGKGKAHKPGPHPEPVALTGAEVTHPVICMTHAEEPEDGTHAEEPEDGPGGRVRHHRAVMRPGAP